MKAKILEILENKARDGWNENQTCIGIVDFDKLADELVKLLPITNSDEIKLTWEEIHTKWCKKNGTKIYGMYSVDFAKYIIENFKPNSKCINTVEELPKLEDGEILEYCCLGYPNDWFEVPSGIVDMKYFEPLKMRIRKPNGETVIVNR